MTAAQKARRGAYARLRQAPQAPFGGDRAPILSPAGTSQDETNGATTLKRFGPLFLPHEYTNWTEESSAHVESAYLGDWSSLAKVVLRGPDALTALSYLGMNDLARFEIGQVKHHVQLDAQGRVASEGVLVRLAEEEFLYTAGSGDWLLWQLSQGTWEVDAEDISVDGFIFGVQGPRSLGVIETVLGEGIRDIGFNRSRPARIGGTRVRLLRTGISGGLGYEIHGPAVAANDIWRAVRDAGESVGLRLLGIRSQPVQHVEAGIATNGLDYLPSAAVTPGAAWQFRQGGIGGSFVPAGGFSDYFRKPVELGWHVRGPLDRDFLGRDALLADRAAGAPVRVFAGLVWNTADVRGVLTAGLDAGPVPDPMELPRVAGPVFDTVLVGGDARGVATGRTLSITLRKMISLVAIDHEVSAPGTDVTVLWGRPGTAQREIRATVASLPFRPDRRRVDVAGLP